MILKTYAHKNHRAALSLLFWAYIMFMHATFMNVNTMVHLWPVRHVTITTMRSCIEFFLMLLYLPLKEKQLSVQLINITPPCTFKWLLVAILVPPVHTYYERSLFKMIFRFPLHTSSSDSLVCPFICEFSLSLFWCDLPYYFIYSFIYFLECCNVKVNKGVFSN